MDLLGFSQRRSPGRSSMMRSPSTGSTTMSYGAYRLPPRTTNPLQGGGGVGSPTGYYQQQHNASSVFQPSGSTFIDSLFDGSRQLAAEDDTRSLLLDSDEMTPSSLQTTSTPNAYMLQNARDHYSKLKHDDVGTTVRRAMNDANDQRTMSSLLRRYDVDEGSIIGRVRHSNSGGASSTRGNSTATSVAGAAGNGGGGAGGVLGPDEALVGGRAGFMSEAYVRSSMHLDTTRRELRNIAWRDPYAEFEPKETVQRVLSTSSSSSLLPGSSGALPRDANNATAFRSSSPAASVRSGGGGGASAFNGGGDPLLQTKVSLEATLKYRVMSKALLPKDVDPDYSALETPAALAFNGVDRRRGAMSNPFEHLYIPTLPTEMLMDTAAVGTSVSTLWDHETLKRGFNDDTLYQDGNAYDAANASVDAAMYDSSVSEEATMFRMLRIRAGDQILPFEAAAQTAAFNPVAFQDHVYDAYIKEMKDRGLKPPGELCTSERTTLAAVDHTPGVFVATKFWDPFFTLQWWERGRDHETVLKYGNVSSAEPDDDIPRYMDRFGNVTYGPMAMHPFRQFLVDYFAEKNVGEPTVKQIDDMMAKNINNLWALESKLFTKYGKPKQVEPLSSKYLVKYPVNAKITFTPTQWTYEIPEELNPKPQKEDKGAKGKKGTDKSAAAAGGKKGAKGADTAEKSDKGTKEKGTKDKGTKDKSESKEKGGTKDKSGSKEKPPKDGTKDKDGKKGKDKDAKDKKEKKDKKGAADAGGDAAASPKDKKKSGDAKAKPAAADKDKKEKKPAAAAAASPAKKKK